MIIELKETLVFSERERAAFDLVMRISSELANKANNPNLRQLGLDIYDKVATLWGYEDEED